MKKLPSQFSTEELMSLLETAPDTPELDKQVILNESDDIIAFTSNYRITPGETPVTKKLLYQLYQTFSSQPLTQAEFTRKIKIYVDDRNSPYLYINQDNFAISQHIYKDSKKRDIMKSLTYQNHFNWFLDKRKVHEGNKWIEGFILFEIYQSFCKERKVKTKLGYKNFHNFLKLHFKSKRLNGNRSLWFRIDEDTYNLLTEEEKEVIRVERKKTGRS